MLVQQHILAATSAIPIVIGANIGTTATALIVSIRMRQTARRGAVANLCFNTFGVLLFLPFLRWFSIEVVQLAGDPGMAVAWAQLVFNLMMVFAVLIVLRVFHQRVQSLDLHVRRTAA